MSHFSVVIFIMKNHFSYSAKWKFDAYLGSTAENPLQFRFSDKVLGLTSKIRSAGDDTVN